jgi:hypothetical protein
VLPSTTQSVCTAHGARHNEYLKLRVSNSFPSLDFVVHFVVRVFCYFHLLLIVYHHRTLVYHALISVQLKCRQIKKKVDHAIGMSQVQQLANMTSWRQQTSE